MSILKPLNQKTTYAQDNTCNHSRLFNKDFAIYNANAAF